MLNSVKPEDIWITDSGASRHMTYRREWLTEFKPTDGEVVSLGNSEQCKVTGNGTVTVDKWVDSEWKSARIENVLLVPDIKRNLFSVGAYAKKGYSATFEQRVIFEKEGKVQARSQELGLKQTNDIYRVFFKAAANPDGYEAHVASTDLRTWHEMLGHINAEQLKTILTSDAVKGVKLTNKKDFFCEACQYGKAHKLTFNSSTSERHWTPGELVHTDVCGPFSETSLGGARYYLLFIDEATDYRVVYFIKHKSDVCEKLKEFDRMVENKYGHSVKILRADNGREYVNDQVKKYLKSQGIKLENTTPYTPQKMAKLSVKIVQLWKVREQCYRRKVYQ